MAKDMQGRLLGAGAALRFALIMNAAEAAAWYYASHHMTANSVIGTVFFWVTVASAVISLGTVILADGFAALINADEKRGKTKVNSLLS